MSTTSGETIAKLQQQMAAIVKFNREERKKREQRLQLLLSNTKQRS